MEGSRLRSHRGSRSGARDRRRAGGRSPSGAPRHQGASPAQRPSRTPPEPPLVPDGRLQDLGTVPGPALELRCSSSFLATRISPTIRGATNSTRCSAQKRRTQAADEVSRSIPAWNRCSASSRAEIPPIPDDVVFEFLYREIDGLVHELQSNSGCRATSTGEIKQARFTTNTPELIEVRLEVKDTWLSADGAEVLPFYLTGTCRYHLRDERLADLKDWRRSAVEDGSGWLRSLRHRQSGERIR